MTLATSSQTATGHAPRARRSLLRSRSFSLRTRLLLVVLLGVLLPLGLVGLWLVGVAERSGEALVRRRLERSLHEIVQQTGVNWVSRRSQLLRLAETPAVQSLLRGERTELAAAGALPPDVAEAWGDIADAAAVVILRDTAGDVRGRLEGGAGGAPGTEPRGPVLPVRIPVYDVASAKPLGIVEAQVPPGVLLPTGLLLTSVGGSVLAAFDPESGAPLLPVSIDPDLLKTDGFRWGGERWLAVQRGLREPPLRLALAAPTEPFTARLQAATRRGTLALLLAVAATVLLATLATRRITRSLERMAEAADAVSRGELDRSVAAEGPDEIERLGRAFNTMTESLRRTLQRLSHQEALAAMGELASSIAHEVRNPLTSIRLDLERAAERVEDQDRTRELLRRAIREIDRLDASVAGALRLARSGRVELSVVDVREPLAAAVAAAGPRFASRGARAEVVDRSGGSAHARGDAAALEQLFLNLLLNAADALEPGGRAVVRVESADGRVRVTIEDNGAGIPPEQLERVFDAFYSTKSEGTGLGLAIARRIATAMGGALTLESERGVGTTARLTLPAESGGVTPATPSVSKWNGGADPDAL